MKRGRLGGGFTSFVNGPYGFQEQCEGSFKDWGIWDVALEAPINQIGSLFKGQL